MSARSAPVRRLIGALLEHHTLYRHPRYGTEITPHEIEQMLADALERSGQVLVPRRWATEAALPLDAASVTGKRSCRDGDHLDYANHERLVAEAASLGVVGVGS